MIERFREELNRALSHRLNPHPGISVSIMKMIGISHSSSLSLPAAPVRTSSAYGYQQLGTQPEYANRIQEFFR